MEVNMDRFFYCYSVRLKKFLMDNGLRYDVVAVNKNSGRTFWTFKRDDKLDSLLIQWNKSKN